ncbi:Small protein A precursor [Kluyvera cryocrescens]|uniref:Outer membrane protein assembly factor BamE n=1 Tax=Kluyvera cryocrescens TaxID=580 RepID=A0A485AQ69_KLUCR|nr:Small protein A precursor [Kluyvera cryocrescens]
MRCKTLTAAAAVLLMMTAGCSTLERVVYRPDISQGNYLVPNDIAKIRTGMTQQQVAYTLGTPMMTDPFGTNTWFYVFRQQPGHEKVTQQTLTLTFNSSGVLTNIDNKTRPDEVNLRLQKKRSMSAFLLVSSKTKRRYPLFCPDFSAR